MSLFTAFAASMLGAGISAGPAAAFSLNPDAGSPGIESFADLHTILTVIVVVVVVAFNVWLLRAARTRTRHHGQSEGRGLSQGRLIGALGVAAVAIFVIAAALSHKGREIPVSQETVAELEEGAPLSIQATGQQWLWRFNYPNGAFSFRRLVVPTGVTVALSLHSTDVVQGWNVPSLTGKAQAVPGRTNTIYFRADEEGTHSGRSSVLNGQGYSTMRIDVDAVSPADYEKFIAQQKTDIEAAQKSAIQKLDAGAEADSDTDENESN